MTFNLTETITISTQEELDAALDTLSTETDPEWLETLRSRAQEFINKNEE